MNRKNNTCPFFYSRRDAERYLLNQMTDEEETLFQQHLDTCATCRSALKQIRDLSQLFRRGEADRLVARTRPLNRLPVRYLFRAAAASVLLVVVGLSVVFFSQQGRDNDEAHDLQIEHQHRDAVGYADSIEVVSSPVQPGCTND
jgi:hypothetical protein